MKAIKFLGYLVLTVFATACTGLRDELEELEDRLDNTESTVGINEPMIFDFNTTTETDAPIIYKNVFSVKAVGYSELEDGIYLTEDVDTYVIVAKRYSSVGLQSGSSVAFQYNAATKEVEQSIIVGEFAARNTYANIYFETGEQENTIEVDVKEIDLDAGLVDFSVEGSTSANAFNNLYEGKPMNVFIRFKGKLQLDTTFFDGNGCVDCTSFQKIKDLILSK
jgi:hypothetical protein